MNKSVFAAVAVVAVLAACDKPTSVVTPAPSPPPPVVVTPTPPPPPAPGSTDAMKSADKAMDAAKDAKGSAMDAKDAAKDSKDAAKDSKDATFFSVASRESFFVSFLIPALRRRPQPY